jgi:protein gp37
MSKSEIEWTEDTWNPIVGCSILSPGCSNCYAMKMAARIEAMNIDLPLAERRARQYEGTTHNVNGNTVWTGKITMAGENILLAPLKRKKPTTYFVNSMGDLFHEDCPDLWIDKVFAVMALSPRHTFQVLTKRAARMHNYMVRDRMALASERLGTYECIYNAMGDLGRAGLTDPYPFGTAYPNGMPWPLPNVWLGVSTERQFEAELRIPRLLLTPAAVRFISAEPLLGPIDLTRIKLEGIIDPLDAFAGATWSPPPSLNGAKFFSHTIERKHRAKLDWVIVGGESGPGARPMHPDWARGLHGQCETAGVPFFFKQWGGINKAKAGRALDGIEYNQMPTTP